MQVLYDQSLLLVHCDRVTRYMPVLMDVRTPEFSAVVKLVLLFFRFPVADRDVIRISIHLV